MDGSILPGLRWTPERVAELRQAIEVDGLSMQEAGDRLGASKNSVIGAVTRHSIKSTRRAFGGWANLRLPEPRPEPHVSGCRWIAGEPAGWRTAFCGGQPDEPGSPWCAEHRAIVFQRERPPLVDSANGPGAPWPAKLGRRRA